MNISKNNISFSEFIQNKLSSTDFNEDQKLNIITQFTKDIRILVNCLKEFNNFTTDLSNKKEEEEMEPDFDTAPPDEKTLVEELETLNGKSAKEEFDNYINKILGIEKYEDKV